jgi:hypothetical protein
VSTLDQLGIPVQIGILLFTLATILALAPYFGGLDFGVLKIPNFPPGRTRVLRRYGWLGPVVALALFPRVWPSAKDVTGQKNATDANHVAPSQDRPVRTTGPRLRIALLPFDTPDPVLTTKFQEFSDALSNRLVSISETFSGRGEAFRYVGNLKVTPGGPSRPSAAELTQFWNTSYALQLLRAQVTSVNPTMIHGLVYLGDLAPTGGRPSVELDLEVSVESFSTNQDGYSLLMLYALARDAQVQHMPTHVVAAYLAEAHGIATQLGQKKANLAPIANAVDEMLRQLQSAESPPGGGS